MASIESRINQFIEHHELDPLIKDGLCVLVTGCMEDLFKHVFTQPVPETGDKTKAKKVLKSDKVEDPTTCQSREELRNCTTGTLNEYCKTHSIKSGGNKSELMDRVWRHLQGQTSDDDKKTKAVKAVKKVPEKHVCFGTTASGADCAISGTELFCGQYFCHRHFSDAQKFIDAASAKQVKTEITPAKPAKTAEKPAKPAKPGKTMPKMAPPPPPPESESEVSEHEEELETDDEEQQETDTEN